MKKPAPLPESPWNLPELDRRPVIVAVAGPNGAGKTTFYEAQLKPAGLRFLNADVLAGELTLDAYTAAEVAGKLRRELVEQRISFVFETVFSDPVGEKLQFLQEASKKGYSVVLCFVGISGVERCEERVAMRVSQGGHDVPTDKLEARYPRTMVNLMQAVKALPCVLIFDNDEISQPFRLIAIFRNGERTFSGSKDPAGFKN